MARQLRWALLLDRRGQPEQARAVVGGVAAGLLRRSGRPRRVAAPRLFMRAVLARQAGATNVINPVSFTGLLLAGSAQGEHIADYMADLASIGGKVQLRERPISAEEIGRGLDQLADGGRGLRVYRGGKPYGFWEPEAAKLEAGDQIVEVVRCEECEGGRP